MDTPTSDPSAAPSSPPLAQSQDGEPFDVPAEATHWRVRRSVAGRSGTPETVLDDEGMALRVVNTVTAAQLRAQLAELDELKPGRYRLDATDSRGRLLGSDLVGCVVITPAHVARLLPETDGTAPPPAAAPPPADPTSRILDALEKAVQANSTALVQVTEKQAALVDAVARLVGAVDAAGVSTREPPPVVVQVPAAEAQPAAPAPPAAGAPAPTEPVPEPPPPWWQALAASPFGEKLGEKLGDMLLSFAPKVAPDGPSNGVSGGGDNATHPDDPSPSNGAGAASA